MVSLHGILSVLDCTPYRIRSRDRNGLAAGSVKVEGKFVRICGHSARCGRWHRFTEIVLPWLHRSRWHFCIRVRVPLAVQRAKLKYD
jgi:hypothetical protein